MKFLERIKADMNDTINRRGMIDKVLVDINSLRQIIDRFETMDKINRIAQPDIENDLRHIKLKDRKSWEEFEKNNQDDYGKACLAVARRVMELLDDDETPLHNGYYPDINTAHGLICKANDDISGGLFGLGFTFMTRCVAKMVARCHERGDEFMKSFNNE